MGVNSSDLPSLCFSPLNYVSSTHWPLPLFPFETNLPNCPLRDPAAGPFSWTIWNSRPPLDPLKLFFLKKKKNRSATVCFHLEKNCPYFAGNYCFSLKFCNSIIILAWMVRSGPRFESLTTKLNKKSFSPNSVWISTRLVWGLDFIFRRCYFTCCDR